MPIIVLTYHNRFYSNQGCGFSFVFSFHNWKWRGRDPVACFYIYLTQIAINRQVVTMTNDYGIIIPRHHEHTRYLPIEYRTGIRPG